MTSSVYGPEKEILPKKVLVMRKMRRGGRERERRRGCEN